jgi:rubrerythrin
VKSDDNLKEAFAGESQANRKYTAFSRKAEQEGYIQIAKFFRAAAEAETVHALNHLRVMKGIGSTLDNAKVAKEGEVYEHTRMYPEFIKIAEAEDRKDARQTFHYANETEKKHAQFYQRAIEALGKGKDLDRNEYFVCQTCGYTVEGEAPEVCPICGSPKSMYKQVA